MAYNDLTKTRYEGLYVDSKGRYFARFMVSGKRSVKSLNTSNLSEARTNLALLVVEARRGLGAYPSTHSSSHLSFGEAVRFWLDLQYQRADLAKRTKDYYATACKFLLEASFTERLIKDVSLGMLHSWWADFYPTVAATVANGCLVALCGAFELQVECGAIPVNIARRIGRVSIPKRAYVLPSRADFERLIAWVDQKMRRSTGEGLQWGAVAIQFMAYSGCRAAEAAGVTWKDVGEEFIRVVGKGNKERFIPIIPPMRALLDLLPRRADHEEVLLVKTPRLHLNAATKALGIGHVRVHDLRHMFATVCIESGVDIKTVAEWLGHADGGVLALRVYGHVRPEHSLKMAKKVEWAPGA